MQRNMIIQILGWAVGIIGTFGINTAFIILNMEISCGINNMPIYSILKLIVLFITSWAYIILACIIINKGNEDIRNNQNTDTH